jgi:tetratricopeptide (TPR) repeat protein
MKTPTEQASTSGIQKTLAYQEEVLAISLQSYGKAHPTVAVSYNNLGLAYDKSGDAQKALACHEKSLAIRLRAYGEAHPDVATSYANLGNTFGSLGDIQKSLEYQGKALAIYLQVYDEAHPDVARSYADLGLLYQYGLKSPEAAREPLEKALLIYQQINYPEEAAIVRGELSKLSTTNIDGKSLEAADKENQVAQIELARQKTPAIMNTTEVAESNISQAAGNNHRAIETLSAPTTLGTFFNQEQTIASVEQKDALIATKQIAQNGQGQAKKCCAIL